MLKLSKLATIAVFSALTVNPVYAQEQPATELSSEITSDNQEKINKQPVVDSLGNPVFIIMLDEATVENTDARDEAPARDALSIENAKDVKGWHLPKARKLVKLLEKEYGFNAINMTSYIFSSVVAALTPKLVDRIRIDPRVEKLIPVYEGLDFASAPPWSDIVSGSETISWGKTAIETNDTMTSSTTMYVIDGGVINHPDLNLTIAPINTYDANTGQGSTNPLHATHVSGIIGARINNTYTRGVNPNQSIISVHSGGDTSTMNSAIDWVFAHAEQNNVYGVANMSISHKGDLKIWAHTNEGGRAIRSTSNRVLFVQAAGNIKKDACNYSFATTYNNNQSLSANPVDGIVVVGGLNTTGAQQWPFSQSNAPYPYNTIPQEDGSNYGSCVEMWAPSNNILSSFPNLSPPISWGTGYLSGTSMAAPFVAGLAARFGSTNATPVQREYHLRSRLSGYPDAGWLYADLSGIAIKMPQLNKVPAYTTPNRLTPVGITASSTLSGTFPSATQDGKYATTTSWNAGSPIGWIEFDLGSIKTIRAIRMSPEQSLTGLTTHNVYVGNTPAPTTLRVSINELTDNKAPIARKFPDNGTVQGRYVRISSDTTGSSWLAWREVETYGN